VWLHCFGLVFFFKQKTAYEMRISDWSSDVCSSDLAMISGCSATSFLPAEVARNARDSGEGVMLTAAAIIGSLTAAIFFSTATAACLAWVSTLRTATCAFLTSFPTLTCTLFTSLLTLV